MRRAAADCRRPLFVLGLVAATALFLATVPLHREWFDLSVYHGAVGHWLHEDGDLYRYVVPGTHYGFTYPPFAAVCMVPIALLPWPGAVATALLLNAAASAAVLYWLAGPVVRRQGWTGWFAFAVAACLFALLEPVRDTFSFGQVNLVLLALVLLDAWLLSTGRGRFAGVATGVAAAVKLTPLIFLCYLAVTRRRRAAGVAAGTAVACTAVGAWAAPQASLYYWTEALWNTDRVGQLAYVSNQSWQGVLARLADPDPPSRLLWALGVAAVLVIWARRASRAADTGDEWAGFALTGVAACLVSPVTWVHHLVWLLPALAVLAGRAGHEDTPVRHRRLLLAVSGVLYVVLCSSVVWLWRFDFSGPDGFLGGNAYVWICLGLLIALPVGRPDPQRSTATVPHAREPSTLGAQKAARREAHELGPGRLRSRTPRSGAADTERATLRTPQRRPELSAGTEKGSGTDRSRDVPRPESSP